VCACACDTECGKHTGRIAVPALRARCYPYRRRCIAQARTAAYSAYAYERVAHVNVHTPTVHTRVCQYPWTSSRPYACIHTHYVHTHTCICTHTRVCGCVHTCVCERESVFVCVTGRACRLRPSSPLSASRAQQVREQCSQSPDTPASGPHLSPCWQVLGHACRRGRESDSVRSLGHMYPHACACMYTHADEGGKKGGQSNTRISTHLH
jgi:hypothetical protein